MWDKEAKIWTSKFKGGGMIQISLICRCLGMGEGGGGEVSGFCVDVINVCSISRDFIRQTSGSSFSSFLLLMPYCLTLAAKCVICSDTGELYDKLGSVGRVKMY